MMKSKKSIDEKLAFELHQQVNPVGITKHVIDPKNIIIKNYQPRALIDQSLELTDPNPNIHTLFLQFNAKFFWNKLLPVEVRWSNKMTSCAGTCTFHSRNRYCVIALSAPLLKLRPRKDLIETLLHEMIHGFLFLTNNNRDRDGHGPEFCKHMNRINKEAGTNITIYHDFHDEVRLYQQHWWRCNGSCQYKAPYFGMVRRAINRAPGPSDFWWSTHQYTCGGRFIKVREPEQSKSKSKSNINWKNKLENSKDKCISNWFMEDNRSKNTSTITTDNSVSNVDAIENNSGDKGYKKNIDYFKKSDNLNVARINNSSVGIIKLGNNTNKVYGWGTGGPNGSVMRSVSKTSTNVPQLFYSDCLGGSSSGKSNLLGKFHPLTEPHCDQPTKKYLPIKKDTNLSFSVIPNEKPLNEMSNIVDKLQMEVENDCKSLNCPVCNVVCQSVADLNDHLDECLAIFAELSDTVPNTVERKSMSNSSNHLIHSKDASTNNNIYSKSLKGPLLTANELDLSHPVIESSLIKKRKSTEQNNIDSKQPKTERKIDLKNVNCPVCNVYLSMINLNDHLDDCLANIAEELSDTTQNTSNYHISTNDLINENSQSIINTTLEKNSTFKTGSNNINVHVYGNLSIDSYKCFVCNSMISSDISLNDHLEICIGAVFNDESISFIDDISVTIDKSTKDKIPCPICMKFTHEDLMNQHLDTCLRNN